MATVITTRAFPNLAAGSSLDNNADAAVYRHSASGTWFDSVNVLANLDIFVPALNLSGRTFFVANADGTVTTVTGLTNVSQIKRNYFLTNARATIVAAKLLAFVTALRDQ